MPVAKNQAEIDAIYSQGADEIASLALPAFAGAPQRTPVQAAANVAAAGISEAPRATSGAKRAGPSRDDIIRRAKELDVDPDFALSLVTQESHGDFATKDSDKGAVGGFQVMGDTYKGVMGSYGGQRDPWNNMEAGLRYIAYGQKTLATKDPALLAAGYHAGYDRDDLKAGKIPNTSDGHIKTADYARQIVARLNQARGTADPDAGRYQPLSDEEAAQLEAKAQLDKEAPGRYKALTDEEAAQLQAQAAKPSDGKLRPNAPANQSLAPVTPAFRAQVERAYDAADPAQRQAMVGAEGVVGQLARERETRFAMAPTTPSAAKFDTRTEARAARLAAAGADGQIAEKWARQGAATGQVPGSELATASPSNFDWEAQKRFYETGFDAEA